MSIIIKGMEKPKTCIECPFLEKPILQKQHGIVRNGYAMVSKCPFDDYGYFYDTSFLSKYVQLCCLISEVDE